MSGTLNDPLSPAAKDPVEGPRGPALGGEPGEAGEASKLGCGGDPAEGRVFDEQTGDIAGAPGG